MSAWEGLISCSQSWHNPITRPMTWAGIGPPRWGLALYRVPVSQAGGLGGHRAAPLGLKVTDPDYSTNHALSRLRACHPYKHPGPIVTLV